MSLQPPSGSVAYTSYWTPANELELMTLLEQDQRDRDESKLSRYSPYPKQLQFHRAGTEHRERLLMAGNQTGKTTAGAFELAMHLSGEYPDWWPGRRWDRPVRFWAGSETAEVTRDGVQRLLIGEPKEKDQWGTGAIPGKRLKVSGMRQGVANAIESILVKHVSGKNSTLGFKSYDQGRTKWQVETLDGVWYDEEPPQDIYTEGLTRTNTTGGFVMLTFTPLKGMSDVVRSFLMSPDTDGDKIEMAERERARERGE